MKISLIALSLLILAACSDDNNNAQAPVITPPASSPVVVAPEPVPEPIAVGAGPDMVIVSEIPVDPVIQNALIVLPERTNIPDKGFETALVSVGLDNQVDGSVLTSKIVIVDKLVITRNFKIKDLKGIENFVSLRTLQVEHNLLESVDLSKNIYLTWVSFWDNQLTELNVSTLKNLDLLGIGDNKISAIDLTKNVNLREIDFQNKAISKTALTSLDLSKNTKLERIYLHFNALTALDTDKLVNLKEFWATNNNFKSLDFSNNKNLNVIVVNDNDLSYLNAKNTYNNGVPRTMKTNNNPKLLNILVNDPVAIKDYITKIDANAGGVSDWYSHDAQVVYTQ